MGCRCSTDVRFLRGFLSACWSARPERPVMSDISLSLSLSLKSLSLLAVIYINCISVILLCGSRRSRIFATCSRPLASRCCSSFLRDPAGPRQRPPATLRSSSPHTVRVRYECVARASSSVVCFLLVYCIYE